MTVIKDWVVQAQWDDSKIQKGLLKLDKSFNKLNRTRSVRAMSKTNQLLEREIKLKGKSYRNEIKAAKQRGKEHAEAIRLDRKFDREKLKREHYLRKVQVESGKMAERQRLFNERESLRLLEKRKDALSKIEDIEYRLGQQRRALGGVKGAEAELGSISNRENRLASLRTAVASNLVTVAGLKDLERDINDVSKATTRARPRITGLTKQLNAQKFAANSLGQSLKNLSRSYLSIFAVIAGGVAVFNIGEQLDQTRASLLAVSGDVKQSAKDWEYIRQTALGLGTDLKVSAQGYQQIGVAAKTMGFSTEQAKNIFMAASESARAFNLSTDDQLGVQRAFVQIMSKGVLSMEELCERLTA